MTTVLRLSAAIGRLLFAQVARLVFWFKHRGGFVDLGVEVLVTGTIVGTEFNAEDGDHCFDLRLDPWCAHMNISFGGKHTTETPEHPDTLHCEIVPWVTAVVVGNPIVGSRVEVVGRWGYDGVHTGSAARDFLRCVFGGAPSPDGWLEIHPVVLVRVLP